MIELFPLICDECEHPILAKEEGWVEWYPDENEDGEPDVTIRLVHAVTCNYKVARKWFRDQPLREFLGAEGLVYLLSLATQGISPTRLNRMVQRLHVSGYDSVFRHVDAAISAGAFEPNIDTAYLGPYSIRQIRNWMDSEGLS